MLLLLLLLLVKQRTVVELGAGTGAGTLLLVEAGRNDDVERNGDVRFVVTDLDVVLHLLRHNVRESRFRFRFRERLEWGKREERRMLRA